MEAENILALVVLLLLATGTFVLDIRERAARRREIERYIAGIDAAWRRHHGGR